MIQQLQLVPLTSCSGTGWREVFSIYREAFPPNEQRREADYAAALADPLFEADCIRLDGSTAGLLFHWQAGAFRYVEHLAVDPARRGGRIGSRALGALCERFGRVVLEIDPPQDEISVRREHFYERLGFRANPHRYIHPSYGPPCAPHRLVLMSYPALLADDEARHFADFVRERVLRYSGNRRPELPRLP